MVATEGFLSYGRQSISQEDIDAVVSVLRGDWLTQGPAVEAFEHALAHRVGAKHAVACSNATTGLHLAAAALDLKPNDAVIVPSITFLSTANAVRFVGAEVVFADVDPDTALMTSEHVADAISRAKAAGLIPRAVFPVHFAGQAAGVGEAAREFRLDIVEDAAHAIGSTMNHAQGDVPVGSCPDGGMTVFSFHPVKTIATGEGGCVTTNDDMQAARLRRLRSHGMVREPQLFQSREEGFAEDGKPNLWYYEMQELGFNYRLSDLQSALGLSQLNRLNRFIERRQTITNQYRTFLATMQPAIRPLACSPAAGSTTGWHLFVALIDFDMLGMSRGQVMAALRASGIGTQVHYFPVHLQPYYVERYGRLNLPGANEYYRRCLSLPLYPDLVDDDISRVCAALSSLTLMP